MNDLSLPDLEHAATAYEELLVPALFQQVTHHVLEAAKVGPGDRVLDVACGTGVLARSAAARVGPGGSVAGLDINPGMLSVAKQQAPAIRWQQSPAESLPYEDRSFDAVVSQFGLMFFNDQRAALGEMFRVLKAKGRLAVAVFDALDKVPAYEAVSVLLGRMVSKQAADALRFPFSLGDSNKLSALFREAGITSPVVTTYAGTGRFQSVRSMIEADVRGWFPLAHIFLDQSQLEALVAEAKDALKTFVTAKGTVEFQLPVHIVTATKE
jgi:ubiquinone/menaquinone biosynthesis C-methylase UbiE